MCARASARRAAEKCLLAWQTVYHARHAAASEQLVTEGLRARASDSRADNRASTNRIAPLTGSCDVKQPASQPKDDQPTNRLDGRPLSANNGLVCAAPRRPMRCRRGR